MDEIDKLDATLARLEAEREQRLAERIEAGEVVRVPLYIVAGSESAARDKVEGAKADKLAELRAAGDQREVVFSVTLVKTGVRRHGEAASGEPWKPTAPPYRPSLVAPPKEEKVIREELPPVIETYIAVQIGRCLDDDDPGTIEEGWFSIDGNVVTVTNATGKFIGSHALLKGEDPKAVAKRLLREKAPAGESFNRRLDYPMRGWA
jgi:hypothetical protein